jgi:hypothetical protein
MNPGEAEKQSTPGRPLQSLLWILCVPISWKGLGLGQSAPALEGAKIGIPSGGRVGGQSEGL